MFPQFTLPQSKPDILVPLLPFLVKSPDILTFSLMSPDSLLTLYFWTSLVKMDVLRFLSSPLLFPTIIFPNFHLSSNDDDKNKYIFSEPVSKTNSTFPLLQVFCPTPQFEPVFFPIDSKALFFFTPSPSDLLLRFLTVLVSLEDRRFHQFRSRSFRMSRPLKSLVLFFWLFLTNNPFT